MKKLKIILPVLVVAIIAAVAAFFYFGGPKNLAVSEKSKVSMGLTQAMKSFDVSDEITEDLFSTNYYEILDGDQYEVETSFSVDAEIDDLAKLVGSKEVAKTIEDLIEEISDVNVTLKCAVDKKEKQGLISADVNAKKIFGDITGDVYFTPDTVAARSKELSKNFIKVTKSDIKGQEELEQIFDMLEKVFDMDYKGFRFSKEEIKHFKDTYGKILEESITDEMLKAEDGTFNSKSCSKETVTFTDKEIKALLNAYVAAYENDKEGKKIIEDKYTTILGEEATAEMMDEFDSSIDEIKDSIDEIEDAKIEFVTYCSFKDVYGTELIIYSDEDKLTIRQTYNGDETKFEIDGLEEGVVVEFTLKNTKSEISAKGKIGDDESLVSFNFKLNKELFDMSFTLTEDGEEAGTFGIKADINTKKDSAKEFEQDAKLELYADIEDQFKGSLKVNLSEKASAKISEDFPDVKKAVTIDDQAGLKSLLTDIQSNGIKYIEKIEKSNLFDIVESLGSLVGTGSSLYDSYAIEDDDLDLNDLDLDDLDLSGLDDLDLDDEDDTLSSLFDSDDLEDEEDDEDDDLTSSLLKATR